MDNFNFYKSKELYGEKYFQLPKVFFTNDKYISISNDAKVAYAILKDRFDYSIKNNWIDENDNIYFIYTVKELMILLQCREGKISKIKKELEEVGLLFQKRCGSKLVNGIKQNLPNRLYLGKPITTAEDVYLINYGIANNANPQKASNSGVCSGIAENANPDEPCSSSVYSGIANNANELYLPSLHLDTLLDTLLDTKNKDFEDIDNLNSLKEQQREEYLLKHYPESHEEQSFLNQENLNLIGLFSDSLADAHNMQGIILRAKKEMEKKHNAVLVVDEGYMHDDLLEIQKDIRKTLHRLYQQRKTDEKIDNFDNYCYGSFKKLFDKKIGEWKIIAAEQEKTVTTAITTHDWVN